MQTNLNRMLLQLFGVVAVFGLAFASQTSLIDDILTAIQNMDDCSSCLEVLVPLQALAVLGNETFVESLTTICDLTGVRHPSLRIAF